MDTNTPHTPDLTGLEDQQMIGPSDLGKLIGRSTKSIKVDVSRRPETLPPRFTIPGTRKVQWRKKDVIEWLEAWAEVQATQRRAQVDFAKAQGIPLEGSRPFHLGASRKGVVASKQMAGQS